MHDWRYQYEWNFLLALFYCAALLAQPRSFDILRYDITLDWRQPLAAPTVSFETRTFPGRNQITLTVTAEQLDTLRLHATSMVIDSVFVNDLRIVDEIQPINQHIAIPLCSPATRGDTLIVTIVYRHISQIYSGHFDPNNRGFYLYPRGYRSGSDQTAARLAYTLGAPTDTRYWLPCYDHPAEKALVSYQVHVPAGFITACNGTLDSVVTVPEDSSLIYYWHHDYPIAPYLMVVHASRYHRYDSIYIAPDRGDTIPLHYYVWPIDWETNGWKYQGRKAFEPLPAMIAAFEHRLGPYPFESYGIAIAQPFLYFAMEHQTMVTCDRRVLSGKHALTLAHELFHQWMGNLVSPASWNDIWITEGAATYGEALWSESQHGELAYQTVMAEKRAAYLRNNLDGRRHPPCYREIREPIDLNDIYNYAITYAKGSWIYHMLRYLVGDSLFFNAWRTLCQRFAYGNLSTAQMQHFFAETFSSAPVPIDTFFQQWVYRPGHPIYGITAEITHHPTQNRSSVLLRIEQRQNTQPVFYMPLQFAIHFTDDRRDTITVLNTQRLQYVSLDFNGTVDSIVFDPAEWILKTGQLQQTITTVPSPPVPAIQYSIHPTELVIRIGAQQFQLERLILWSITGAKIYQWTDNATKASSTSIIACPRPVTGLYFIECSWRSGKRMLIPVSIP